MQTDVWVTIFFITIGTLPFSSLVLSSNTLPQLQESLATQSFWDVDIISTLQNMFSLVLGDWQNGFYCSCIFHPLLDPLSGTAAFTRTISDYLISWALFMKKKTLERFNKTNCIFSAISLRNFLFFITKPNNSFINCRYLGRNGITHCEYWSNLSIK